MSVPRLSRAQYLEPRSRFQRRAALKAQGSDPLVCDPTAAELTDAPGCASKDNFPCKGTHEERCYVYA